MNRSIRYEPPESDIEYSRNLLEVCLGLHSSVISPYPTVGIGSGERADDLHLLNNGSRTPVRDDNRQSVELVFRNVGVEGSDLHYCV